MERGWEGRRPGKGPSLRSQPLHAGKVPLSTGNPYHLKSPGALAYAMGGCGALTGAVPRRREQVRLWLRATEGPATPSLRLHSTWRKPSSMGTTDNDRFFSPTHEHRVLFFNIDVFVFQYREERVDHGPWTGPLTHSLRPPQSLTPRCDPAARLTDRSHPSRCSMTRHIRTGTHRHLKQAY